MKRNTFTIALILVWGFISSLDSAANGKELTKQQKKELRKEKKILRKAENEKYNKMMHANACQALQDLDFVLEAHTLQGKRGNTINVSGNLNFISVDQENAVLQLAFKGYGGPNGLGGITLTGKISQKEYRTDKHGNKYLKFNVMGAVLNAEVRISLSASGNYADANVDAATTSGKIKFRGKLVPSNKSTTYKSGLDI